MPVGAGASAVHPRDDGTSPLIKAAEKGHVEVVRELLGAGADVDQTGDIGATPLYFAAQEGRLEVARVLMDAGADHSIGMNAATSECGWTPLIAAAWSGHPAVVAELLQRGHDECDRITQPKRLVTSSAEQNARHALPHMLWPRLCGQALLHASVPAAPLATTRLVSGFHPPRSWPCPSSELC